MPKSSGGPGDTPPGNPPAGNANGAAVCCICGSRGAVNSVGDSKYFSAVYNPGWNICNKCNVEVIRTATGGEVKITKTFSLRYSNGATEAAHKATVTGAITSAMSTWTSEAEKWRVEVKQPGCELQKMKMIYIAKIVASGADVSVTVDGSTTGDLRSYVSGGIEMNFYINDPDDVVWTMVHEIGHTFGLPDEYVYSHPSASPAPTCVYKAADAPDKTVTLSPSAIPPEVAGTHSFDNATIMGQAGNTTYPDHVFYWVAIEAKRVLAEGGASAEVKIVAR